MTTAMDVAKWFIHNTSYDMGDNITPLKLQKLIYYAQAWHLLANEKPLFEEELQAWAHGPVAPSVFYAYRELGWRPIPPIEEKVELSDEQVEILTQVLDIYGEFTAKRLEAMTHAEEPWIVARGDCAPEDRCEEIIPKGHIFDYFKSKFGEIEDGQKAA